MAKWRILMPLGQFEFTKIWLHAKSKWRLNHLILTKSSLNFTFWKFFEHSELDYKKQIEIVHLLNASKLIYVRFLNAFLISQHGVKNGSFLNYKLLKFQNMEPGYPLLEFFFFCVEKKGIPFSLLLVNYNSTKNCQLWCIQSLGWNYKWREETRTRSLWMVSAIQKKNYRNSMFSIIFCFTSPWKPNSPLP